MNDRDVLTYLLRRPSCGHVVGVCVDDGPEMRKEAAKFCSDGIRDGLIVERTTVGAVWDKTIGEWCVSICPQSPHFGKKLKPRQKSLIS